MFKIVINGLEQEMPEATTVKSYLDEMGFVGNYVAVAINGNIIDRKSFPEICFSNNDIVEIVRPVGGG